MAILQECPTCRQKRSNKLKLCPCGENLEKAKRSNRVRYWITYRLRGKQRWESVGFSLSEARDAEGKRRAQKREGKIFELLPESKTTFKELSKWYLGLESVKALSSYWLIELTLKKFNSVFGDKVVKDIRIADLENYQQKRLSLGIAPATIDHEIRKPKTMIIKAFDNGMISGDTLRTFKKAKRLLKKGTDVRDRILSADEFMALVRGVPRHVADIVKTAYYTGMRKSEILNLTWDNVDLKNGEICLNPDDTKTGKGRKIPMCDDLKKVFEKMPRAIHDNHAFLYRGKPVTDIRKGLKKGCKEAGIVYGRGVKGGFIFHDLRHTAVTNMRKAGVAESVIMTITGHETREMFDRYNSVDADDTRAGIDQMGIYLKNVYQTVYRGKNKAG